MKSVEVDGKAFEAARDVAYYLIGNGGSATIAQHVAVDMVKKGYHAVSLTDPAVMSMLANDSGWIDVYAEQVKVHMGGHDVLIAISSSGESPNIHRAVWVAKALYAKVITLSGFSPDNQLRTMGHVNYYVPSHNYGVVEITHLAILHNIVNPG